MEQTYTEKQQIYKKNISPQLLQLKRDIYSLENLGVTNEQINKEINSIKLLISSIEYDIKHMNELDNDNENDNGN